MKLRSSGCAGLRGKRGDCEKRRTFSRSTFHSKSSIQMSCSECVTKSSRASSRAQIMNRSGVPTPSAKPEWPWVSPQ